MLGLGKWKFYIDTMFFRGDAILIVRELEGAYDVDIDLPQLGMELPEFSFSDLQQEGNTITGNAQTDLLKGKNIAFSATFEGDSANGFLKIPFIGKIKLNNGVRIAE